MASLAKEGEEVAKGSIVARISGPAGKSSAPSA